MTRPKGLLVVGAALLALGLLLVTYNRIVLERTERRSLGPFSVQVPKRESISVPRAVGWTLLGAGAVAVGAGLYLRRPS